MRKSLTVPVLALVAAVALVLGTFGQANAAALTAKQVKKIAAKVVAQKAPGLSVAKAKTADSATTAGTATTASNATSLGGVPASVYQDRVAAAALTTPSTLATSGSGTPLVSATITVPAGVSFISIAGAASYDGGTTIGSVWWDLNGTCAATPSATSGYNVRAWIDTSNGSGVGSASVHKVIAAPAGTHTVRLCGRVNANVNVEAADLTVETVANGSTGGSTLKQSGSTAPAPDGY